VGIRELWGLYKMLCQLANAVRAGELVLIKGGWLWCVWKGREGSDHRGLYHIAIFAGASPLTAFGTKAILLDVVADALHTVLRGGSLGNLKAERWVVTKHVNTNRGLIRAYPIKLNNWAHDMIVWFCTLHPSSFAAR
jgi:hypothetical protein